MNIYLFMTLIIKIKIENKFLQLKWEKNCQVILHSLGTSHHQALGRVVNGNVKQISKTFGIASS